MKSLRVFTLTKYMLLLFMVALMAGSFVAEAKVTKPDFAKRFDKRRVYKVRKNNVITVKQGPGEESKKSDFAKHFDKRRVYKVRKNNVITVKQGPGAESKKPAFAEYFEKKKAYKHRGGNVITVKQRVQK